MEVISHFKMNRRYGVDWSDSLPEDIYTARGRPFRQLIICSVEHTCISIYEVTVSVAIASRLVVL